jgi:arylsulfatase A-like enzyme
MSSHRSRTSLLAAALLAGTVVPASLAACRDRGAGRHPAPVDVVLIVIDTLRGDVVPDPEDRYRTPNIDRLAREGVVFPRAFSAAPLTLPSHISLFSSRPPFETRVTNNGQTVPRDLPLVAEWLGARGYDCRAVISLGTLDPLHERETPARGFDSYDHDYWDMSRAETTVARLRASLDKRERGAPLFLFAHFADPHEPYDANGSEVHAVEVRLDGAPLKELLVSEMNQWKAVVRLKSGRNVFEFHSLDRPPGRFRVRRFECRDRDGPREIRWEEGGFMERVSQARAVIDRADAPDADCALRLWINDVPVDDDARRRRYAGEVAYVDRYVGELLAELEQRGLYQDSLVVFTSDHGEAMGEHKQFGHAERLSDDQIHVPLIIKLPRNDPRRSELERAAAGQVTHLDLVPTLLEIAGLPPLPGQRGISLFEPHDSVHIAETHRPDAKRTQFALRDAQFKMVYFPDEERFEMYDLAADPGEEQDVFADQASKRGDWAGKLRAFSAQSQAPARAERDAELEAQLRALGYGGSGEEPRRNGRAGADAH